MKCSRCGETPFWSLPRDCDPCPCGGHLVDPAAAGRTTAASIVAQYGHTWEADFRIHALGLGLTVESVTPFDPTYGWTVLLADGREAEGLTTVGVRAALDRLAAVPE